jgi:uncharacterized protein
VPILLPVASVCISLILLAGVGAGIGLLSGLFGVGGGFLLTPLLMMTGVPATVAAASVSCQMVASSSSGVAAHFRLGNVDVKIGCVLLLGGLAGGGLGVEAVKVLRTLGEADLAITLAYVVVLGALGAYMFCQSLRTLRHGSIEREHRKAPKTVGFLARLPWQMYFPRSGVRHSILVPLILAVLAGVLASVMGVGGGFIMLPLMIYLLGMPTHVAVGTSLFQILFLSAGVTFMQADANHTVDLMLVLPLALSSAIGAQLGARLSRLLRGEQLVILLAALVLAVTGKMATGLFVKPSSPLAPVEITRRREESTPLERCNHRATGLYSQARGWDRDGRVMNMNDEPARTRHDRARLGTAVAAWPRRALMIVGLARRWFELPRGGTRRSAASRELKCAASEHDPLEGSEVLQCHLPFPWPASASA